MDDHRRHNAGSPRRCDPCDDLETTFMSKISFSYSRELENEIQYKKAVKTVLWSSLRIVFVIDHDRYISLSVRVPDKVNASEVEYRPPGRDEVRISATTLLKARRRIGTIVQVSPDRPSAAAWGRC